MAFDIIRFDKQKENGKIGKKPTERKIHSYVAKNLWIFDLYFRKRKRLIIINIVLNLTKNNAPICNIVLTLSLVSFKPLSKQIFKLKSCKKELFVASI